MQCMRYRIFSALLLLGNFWSLTAKELTVPSPNKFYGLKPYHDSAKIEIADEEPIFYILVHGTFSSETDSKDPEMIYWGEDEFIENVPKDFFGPNTNPEKAPIRVSFRWSGNMSDDARKKGGKKLAEAIRQLYDAFPNAYVICCGHSHGGNVMNVASQDLDDKHTIDFAIQLATPVMCYNEKKEVFDNTSGYYPNSKAINTLMIFYSEYDFVQTGGAGQVNFKRRYAPIPGIDLYNVRMRKLRGKDDLHVHMHDDVIGRKILQLCNKIKQTYKGNKNLIADITPAERRRKSAEERKVSVTPAELEMPLVSIKPYSGKKKSTVKAMFQGISTDALWPDWTGKYPAEIAASNIDAAIFEKIFGFSIDQRLSDVDRSIDAGKQIAKEAKRRAEAFASDAADKASEAAKKAKQQANDAAKKAKNYLGIK
jgi:hypothetical protein